MRVVNFCAGLILVVASIFISGIRAAEAAGSPWLLDRPEMDAQSAARAAIVPAASAKLVGGENRDTRGAAAIEIRWDAVKTATAGGADIRLDGLIVGDVSIDMTLHKASDRRRVLSRETQFVIGTLGGEDRPFDFNAEQVIMLTGKVDGRPESRTTLCVSPRGAVGTIWLGGGQPPLRIVTDSRAGGGRVIARLMQVADAGNAGGSVPMCGVPMDAVLSPLTADESAVALDDDDAPVDDSDMPGGALAMRDSKLRDDDGGGRVLIQQPVSKNRKVIELAVDTDYPYFALFNDRDAAAMYVLQLYDALSVEYEREVNAEIKVVYVRLWETPDDPYRTGDPSNTFPYKLDSVQRDLGQLLCGRRDLSYGGVAYGTHSVAGYMQGWYPDPAVPSPWNWDVFVTGHEMGHTLWAGHTDNYGIDNCNLVSSTPQRGGFMSYCSQTVSGGNSVTDMRFETPVRKDIFSALSQSNYHFDCNLNGVPDNLDILDETSTDANKNNIPDECEDCNQNGVLDDKDIRDKTSKDLNANGIPDECEPDCNGNGRPDDVDIARGSSKDERKNGIPDECEEDCDGNGKSDFVEINATMTLDLNRNTILDACEDCDGDGVIDLEQLPHAHNAWVASHRDTIVRELHGYVGVVMNKTEKDHVNKPNDVLITADERVLISSSADHRIVEFDVHGNYIGDLVAAGRGGLSSPACMVIGSNGNLLVASGGTDSVLEYDIKSGEFVGEFVVKGDGGLVGPFGMALYPGGNLFVTGSDDQVREYDGTTGASIGVFVTKGDNGGLSTPRGMTFKQDGNLLVCSFDNLAVMEYDGRSGAFVRQFNSGGTTGVLELKQPWCVRVGPDRQIYVSHFADIEGAGMSDGHDDDDHDPRKFGNVQDLHVTTGRIYMYQAQTGKVMRAFVLGNDTKLFNTTGFDFVPGWRDDCNANFRQDNCDLLFGSSQDEDGDSVPDECQIDCDGNGVVDRLELMPFGPKLDRNFNGIPDECDIRDHHSRDCDDNGIPDEAETTQRFAFADSFEFANGWTTRNHGASAGQWTRRKPINDPDYAYDPESDSDGSGQCYLTGNTAGESDVDNGMVELISPQIDATGAEVLVQFDYFLRLSDTKDHVDRLLVEISTDDANGTWTQIARFEEDGGPNWHRVRINQSMLDALGVTPTSKTRLRFQVNDSNPQSIVEAAVDSLRVIVTKRPCRIDAGDMNCDSSVDFNDIDGFISALVSRDAYEAEFPFCTWLNGDIDRDGDVSFNDIDGFTECLIGGGCAGE